MNASSNSSQADVTYGIPDEFKFLLLGLYGMTCFLSLLGNGMICYKTVRLHSFRAVTNFFIVSLAVTDIITTALCVPFSILSNLIFHYWPFWGFLCPLIGFLQMTSVLMRSFVLMAMTCDMCRVTTKPLKSHILTMFRAKLLVLFIIILSCTISLPTFIYSHIEYMPYEPGSKGLCVEIWPHENIRTIYGVCIMVIQYVIPLVIIVVSYIHIGVIIWRKRIPGEANVRRDKRLATTKHKTIKTIVVIVVAYLVLWLPLHVITIIGDVDQSIFDYNYVHVLWLTAHWLAFSNSAVNPVIYFWMKSKIRHNMMFCRHVIVCCPGKHKTYVVSGKNPSHYQHDKGMGAADTIFASIRRFDQ